MEHLKILDYLKASKSFHLFSCLRLQCRSQQTRQGQFYAVSINIQKDLCTHCNILHRYPYFHIIRFWWQVYISTIYVPLEKSFYEKLCAYFCWNSVPENLNSGQGLVVALLLVLLQCVLSKEGFHVRTWFSLVSIHRLLSNKATKNARSAWCMPLIKQETHSIEEIPVFCFPVCSLQSRHNKTLQLLWKRKAVVPPACLELDQTKGSRVKIFFCLNFYRFILVSINWIWKLL